MFHTPPYSQPISLQEGHEYKTNIRTSKHMADSKSPLPQKYETLMNQHKSDTSPNSTIIRDKSNKSTLDRVKEKDSGSPLTTEKRGRRFSYSNSRPVVHDVPYYRLLDASPKQPHKTKEHSVESTKQSVQKQTKEPEPVPKIAPQSNQIPSDSENSLSPKLPDDVVSINDVQRTVSLTSENPSECFFSADEDLHASRSSSLKTTDGVPLIIPKKRFASDLSIGGQNELEGKLSSHRSDYEIHTPEHRSLPTRPQSTAELVSFLICFIVIITAKELCLKVTGILLIK